MEKPKIYKNIINKEINNNLKVYDDSFKEKIFTNNDIRRKVRLILNSNSFIYSKLVTIKFKDSLIKKQIIGLNGNNLVTLDNEYIPLDNITDIYS